MNCAKLNEGTYDKIIRVLEGTKAEEDAQPTYYKSLYSPATLINDWAEKRTAEQPLPTSTEPPLSEQMDQYRKPCETPVPDRREYFDKVFESSGYGQELLLDHLGFSYYGNYVSSYDLCYNHLTKGLCGPFPRRYYNRRYKPENDLSLIYGNLTQWGLKEKVYARIKSESQRQCIISENKAEYIQYNLSEVKKLNDFPSFKKVKATY